MDGVSKVARSGQIVIGLIYLVAGAIKVWEPVLFYWEAIPYTQILGIGRDNWEQATAVAKVATLLGPIEFALGVALLLNWRPQISLPVATVLMAFFTGLMVKAWQMGASIDCGCFGALVERSPGEAGAARPARRGLSERAPERDAPLQGARGRRVRVPGPQ